MPTQLYTNQNITFICGRNFTWEGRDYKMGEEWDQELAIGRLDALVRSRYLYPVVETTDEKPRHWHHHVHVREVLEKKLGITRELGQSSIATRLPQGLPDFEAQDRDAIFPNEPVQDEGQLLKDKAIAAYATERVLVDENEEEEPEGDLKDGQTEPVELLLDEEHREGPVDPEPVKDDDGNVVVGAAEQDEDEEREITEEDLYDPAEHSVEEVMDYLAGEISEPEYDRVVAAERVGKARKGILNNA